mmetsp:Transcript_34667/g.63244  ORF Transcript_34667/g.63244 Transcript_34667/m.63244 type:complete len:577 (-) Transcript_34667:58-1788(-)
MIANPRNVPMFPRPPPGPPPTSRGGFFRALNFYRQTNVFTNDFEGAIPTTSSSPDSDDQEDQFPGSLQQQLAKESLAASLFLDKLNLKLLERLWVAIKKNCMLNTAAARNAGVYEAISLQDFLRLAWQQIPHHTQEDEQFLERLFHCVDRRRKGSVRTTDIATALVLICNADPIPKGPDGLSKLKTLFRIFDADDDSCLTHDEIFDMYLSIKVNDITKTRQALVADIAFDDELSLQEAKRLYELTIELLNAVSDFVIFEEFKKVFDERPHLINDLLPGAFTLEWILTDYKPPVLESNTFGSDVRRGLIEAMRRGEEHLDLSKKRGRGMRIMQNCLNLVSHKPLADEEQSQATDRDGTMNGSQSASTGPPSPSEKGAGARASRASLPKLTGASKTGRTPRRASRQDRQATAAASGAPSGGAESSKNAAAADSKKGDAEEVEVDIDENDDSDEDGDVAELYGHSAGESNRGGTSAAQSSSHSGAMSTNRGQGGVASSSVGKSILPEEALELPQLQVLKLNNKNAKRFRSMTLDAKTQQAYLRDKKDVNRTLKYQCLVCAVNHDFRLSKSVASAEHQHF